jgi:hypothetical protein
MSDNTGSGSCADGHVGGPGAAFCARCGAALAPAQAGTEPAAPPPPPPPSPAPPGYPVPLAGYGMPPGTGPGGYAPAYQYPYTAAAPSRSTNGMAIASMVLGILWLYWIGSILALVFGYIALSQIRQRGEGGRGMAIAGVVLAWIGIGIAVIGIVVAIIVAATSNAGATPYS